MSKKPVPSSHFARVFAPVAKIVGVQRDCDGAGLPRFDANPLEALELAYGTGCAAGTLMDVQLNNLVAIALARVSNANCRCQCASG